MAIQFTQFLLPDGRRRTVEIDMSEEVEAKAKTIVGQGYSFEIEILTTGLVHMDCNNGEDVLSNAICENGPEIIECVEKIVNESYERLESRK
ncbi:MAG: hypothetical protein GTO24_21220 [candidate division Zixibacteria bacterium]|nr:hypothetical protein [candidate division Zixibacteria bacterium]